MMRNCRLLLPDGRTVPIPDTEVQVSMTVFTASILMFGEICESTMQEAWHALYCEHLARRTYS